MDDLHNELSSNPPLPGSYTARKGDLCAALFVDNNWYATGKFVDTINEKESFSYPSPHPPPPPSPALNTFWIQLSTSLF